MRNSHYYYNLIDEYFLPYYKEQTTFKNSMLKYSSSTRWVAKDYFKVIQEMLSESKHGMILKDFGTIVPKDSLYEYNDGIFKKGVKIKSKYLFFFSKDWLNENYKTVMFNYNQKPQTEVRETKPQAINLHRRKVKRD